MISTRFRIALAASILLPLAATGQSRVSSVIPAFNVADLDRSARACDDFARFANGGWLDKNSVPAAYSSWGPFTVLTERNGEVLKQVLERAQKQARTTKDADTRKLGDFYASCMDSAQVEALGATPLKAPLARIDAINSRAALLAAITEQQRYGNSGFSLNVDQDAKKSDRIVAYVSQGGLSLPDRDYYIKTDAPSQKTRDDLVDHIAKMFQLAGFSAADAQGDAQRILSLETSFAKASRSRVELRDPNLNYNLLPLDSLSRLAPAVDWSALLRGIGIRGAQEIVVEQPGFIAAFNTELTDRPIDDWKAYLRWKTIAARANFLGSAFVNQNFAFSSKLNGAREQQPRWRRCMRLADSYLGDALGREYTKTHFTPGAKSKMLIMVNNLRAVIRDRINAAEWMSTETRKQALVKLASFTPKIGYPDTWRTYAAVPIDRNTFAANAETVIRVERARNLAKYGKPVDRSEWFMTVPTVNAYYNPALNEIVFPGGRLQPPFFHVSYDDPANYGGVGGTIGHEMSHGFDDQGRQYDSQGNLRDWWTAEDASRYTQRASVVERQYSEYKAADSLYVNGKLTLGENLADVVGVSVALEAMERAMKGKPRKIVNGFTPEQRFFLAYAQARRANIRPEQLKLMIRTDPHSPGQFRINGPLSNMAEFARAFACKPGDAMVRPDSIRARIW
ncbi:MAG: M13 family metallopeptidase [Gemmatimonadaceae bacterium]|nr:M13 family metallopeptidase [Gemmatimonadaceae bacterium]